MANQFEQAGRAKKVRALVAHFDAWIKDAGHDATKDALLVAETLHKMKDPVWEQHAAVCGLKRPPSELTRQEVIATYLSRVESPIHAPAPESGGASPFERFAS